MRIVDPWRSLPVAKSAADSRTHQNLDEDSWLN
jgi:hypothetical protein